MVWSEKKAASVLLFDRESFQPTHCRKVYQSWLREYQIGERTAAERVGKLARVSASKLVRFAQRAIQFGRCAVTLPVVSQLARSGRLTELARYDPEFDHVLPRRCLTPNATVG